MQLQELLEKLVSINSVYPSDIPNTDRPGEREIAEFIENRIASFDFTVQRQQVSKGRFNVLAEKGWGEHALLLYGHMDTVPVAEGWSADPWKPRRDGDRLYGLGAHDMKAGLCTILRVAQDFTPETYKLKLAFLVDEENISEGAYTLIQSPWMKDVIAAMVPESGTSQNQQLGPRLLTLGRRGRVDLDIKVHGRSAHAAWPELAVSALLQGATVALSLDRLPLAEHSQLGRSSATIRRFVSEGKGLSIPDLAELRIDRHLVPPETVKSAQQDAEQLIEQLYKEGVLTHSPDLSIEVTIPTRRTPYLMPYMTSVDHPFVRLVARAVKDRFGQIEYSYGQSVADENYFGAELGLPVVVIGPAGDKNHAPDEWVSLASIEELILVYKDILVRFNDFVSRGDT